MTPSSTNPFQLQLTVRAPDFNLLKTNSRAQPISLHTADKRDQQADEIILDFIAGPRLRW